VEGLDRVDEEDGGAEDASTGVGTGGGTAKSLQKVSKNKKMEKMCEGKISGGHSHSHMSDQLEELNQGRQQQANCWFRIPRRLKLQAATRSPVDSRLRNAIPVPACHCK
jgi:hypothetical protein